MIRTFTSGDSVVTEEIDTLREIQIKNHNEVGLCMLCGKDISDKVEAINAEMLNDLLKVYHWAAENKKYEFKIGQVKHLISHSSYSNFSNLREAGGLMYHPKDAEGEYLGQGWYGMAMKRVRDFFRGEFTVPCKYVKDGITGKLLAADYVHVRDFPSIIQWIDANGMYDHETMMKSGAVRIESKNGRPTVDEYLRNQPPPGLF